jgi:hypothetical protein
MAHRGAAVLHRHWPLVVVLALAALPRGAAWLAIQPAWWILGDSIGYLHTSMTHQPESWRPGGYSEMVLLPLWPFHSLALVTAVQHLLGLATGTLVYATLLRLGLPRWAAALAAVPALLDGNVVASEQMIASEALFSFLVVAALALLLARAPSLLVDGAAGVVLGLSTTTRIVALPLIGIAVLTLLLGRAGWSRAVAICVAFALPLALYSVWFDHYYGQFNVTASNGVFLYGRTTNFVDCGRVHFSSERVRSLCPAEPVGRRNEIFLVFGSPTPLSAARLTPAAANSLAQQFAVEAIRAQPLGYAALTWDGLVRSFAWDTSSQPMDMRFEDPELTNRLAQLTAASYQRSQPVELAYRPDLVRALASYQDRLTVRGPMALLGLLLAVAGLFVGRDPDRRGLRAATLLTAGTAAVLLLVPAATAIVAPRYRVPAIPALGMAAVLGATLLWNRVNPSPSGPWPVGSAPGARSGLAAGRRARAGPRPRRATAERPP